jgi:predicted DNA-binding protein
MRRADRREGNRRGRPPAGAHPGEKVTDYPQVRVRVPPDVKVKLDALSMLLSKPQWRIMSESIACFIRSLPESEQRIVQERVNRRP